MQTDMNDINSIVVNAKSPDHSVKARLSGGELTVELDPRAMPHHNESSLARQCSTAVSQVFSGGERAVAAYLERRNGASEPADPQLLRMRERFGAELDALVTSGSSGPATVTMRGRSTVEVALRPRTVNYQSPEQLTRHLNAALAEARRARETPTFDIYMRVFG